MPAKSQKQLKFMRAVAHDAKFAAKVKVSQNVADDFSRGLEPKKKKKRDPMKHGYEVVDEA